MSKKTAQMAYRVSPDEKVEIEDIAEELGMPPSAMIYALVRSYIKDYKSHGDRLVWPPRFTYYEAEARTSQDANKPHPEPNELAG